MDKIYVASSWRNERQPAVVAALREANFDTYDFRQPGPGLKGFNWREIDPDWQRWSLEAFRSGLAHPIARLGFRQDFEAMRNADACLLVNPCGRSAHLEAGWMAGAGKPVVILGNEGDEPELMYLLANAIAVDLPQAIYVLRFLLRNKETPRA